jgi:hypothetical protein
MRYEFLHLAYFMMLKQKTHPNMNYHLFSDWGRSWALLKSSFVDFFVLDGKPKFGLILLNFASYVEIFCGVTLRREEGTQVVPSSMHCCTLVFGSIVGRFN